MKALVNEATRKAKMRAHTATHLLHYMLDHVLDGTKQAGSLVDDDYLRFDFATKQALSHEQIVFIEKQINTIIFHALPVVIEEMSYTQAIDTGAKAFFEDTYGDIVRVVQIIDKEKKIASIELCGGTHVDNTSDIGACKIIEQTAVASGIRRIVAVTGTKVVQYTQTLESQQQARAEALGCQVKQISEQIEKHIKEYHTLQAKYEQLQTTTMHQYLQTREKNPKHNFDYIIEVDNTILASYTMKDIISQAKHIWHSDSWIFYTNEGAFVLYSGKKDFSVKAFAKQAGLQGGGSDQLVQGKDATIISLIKT